MKTSTAEEHRDFCENHIRDVTEAKEKCKRELEAIKLRAIKLEESIAAHDKFLTRQFRSGNYNHLINQNLTLKI